jgi:hypothetical protein
VIAIPSHRNRAASTARRRLRAVHGVPSRVRHDDRGGTTRHMIRLRHAGRINGREADEGGHLIAFA